MRLLLDTHVLIWWLANAQELPHHFRTLISAPEHQVYVSIVSVWEMMIKQSIGKLDVPSDLEQQLEHHRFQLLPLQFSHVARVAALPFPHRDPFDRILICQSLAENLLFLSTDSCFKAYQGLALAHEGVSQQGLSP